MSSKFSIAEKTKVFINLFWSKTIIHLILFGFSFLQFLQVISGSPYHDDLLILSVKLIFSWFLWIYIIYWWKIYFKILTSNNTIVIYIFNTFICLQIVFLVSVFLGLVLFDLFYVCFELLSKIEVIREKINTNGVWLKLSQIGLSKIGVQINTEVLHSFFSYF